MIKRRHARTQTQASDSPAPRGGLTVTLTPPSPLMPLPLLRPLAVPASQPLPAMTVTPDQDPLAVPDDVAEAVRQAISAIGDAAQSSNESGSGSPDRTGSDTIAVTDTTKAAVTLPASARRPGFLRRLFGGSARG